MKQNNLFLLGVCLILSGGLNAQKQQKTPKNFVNSVFYEQLKEKAQQYNGTVRCASYEYDQYLNSVNPRKETIKNFENWFAPKIKEYKKKQKVKNVASATAEIVTIPVVVHVIHDNKPYGVDENISDERVLSQITVLNQDFRRMVGTPGFSSDPVAADTEIQFCLAQRKPNGEPTNGINRVNIPTPSIGGFKTWFIDEIDGNLKPATVWDSSEYLNIWVVDNIFVGLVMGYAQFPQSSGLDGLVENINADTDGVVIDWNAFGSIDLAEGTYYDSVETGRTATHEIGHWLGLRHIWGDNPSCQVDAIDSFNDYCLDTPPADDANDACSDNSTCSATSMFRNYMDYSPNTCQNIFTEDQKTRMRTALENSPRRIAITNSSGCLAPQDFEAKIDIVSLGGSCNVNVNPVVRLWNVGTTTTITSAVISYGIEGETPQNYNWTGSINPHTSTDITLPIVSFQQTANFVVSLVSVNGTTDGNPINNSKSKEKQVNIYTDPSVKISLTTDTYGNETSWTLTNNSDGMIVAQGNNYNSHQSYEFGPFNLTEGNCYTFTIFDEQGDGICCDYGNGSYTVTSGSDVIVSGGTFGLSESSWFAIGTVANVLKNDLLDEIRLYPNPVSETLNISIPQTTEKIDVLQIYNTLGQLVTTQKIDSSLNVSLDVSSFAQGVYLIKITGQNSSKTLRFVKQ